MKTIPKKNVYKIVHLMLPRINVHVKNTLMPRNVNRKISLVKKIILRKFAFKIVRLIQLKPSVCSHVQKKPIKINVNVNLIQD